MKKKNWYYWKDGRVEYQSRKCLREIKIKVEKNEDENV